MNRENAKACAAKPLTQKISPDTTSLLQTYSYMVSQPTIVCLLRYEAVNVDIYTFKSSFTAFLLRTELGIYGRSQVYRSQRLEARCITIRGSLPQLLLHVSLVSCVCRETLYISMPLGYSLATYYLARTPCAKMKKQIPP